MNHTIPDHACVIIDIGQVVLSFLRLLLSPHRPLQCALALLSGHKDFIQYSHRSSLPSSQKNFFANVL